MTARPPTLIPPNLRGTIYLGLLASAGLLVSVWPPTSNTLPFFIGALGASLAVYLSRHPAVKPPELWAPVMLVISGLSSVLLGTDWALSNETAGMSAAALSLVATIWLARWIRAPAA